MLTGIINVDTYSRYKSYMEQAFEERATVVVYDSNNVRLEKSTRIDMNNVKSVEDLDALIQLHKGVTKIYIISKEMKALYKKSLEEQMQEDICICCGNDMIYIQDIEESGYKAKTYECQVCGTTKFKDDNHTAYDVKKLM